MIEKLIKAGATVLAVAMLAACGGENGPETGKAIETALSSNATVAATPTRTPETEPARAQRLDHLLPSPTTKPEAKTAKTTARATNTAETKAAGKPTPTGETESATAPAIPRLNITDLAPENPQTNDQVLLQDIYEQIDLEQFALDPNEPIPIPFVELRGPNQASLMKYPEVHEHPYLHLFPELKHIASQSEGDISYIPFMSVDFDTFKEGRNHFDLAGLHNGLTYFIYNPWFEQVQYQRIQRMTPYLPTETKYLGRQDAEPYWFGNNSTRGILAETVTKLLEEAKLSSAEPYPRDWWTQDEYSGQKTMERDSFAPRDWTLDEYIRTGVEYPGPEADSFEHWQVEFHSIPQITWEFLDPKLPILRVTAHAQQRLPLTDPASYEPPKPSEAMNRITLYSVSFVISLQNRWTSFDDPDRWIVRFGEDLEMYIAPPHHVDRGQGKGPSYIPDFWKDPSNAPDYWKDNDREPSTRYETIKRAKDRLGYTQDTGLTYPDYWDDTDYMQHRIIGPVLLTVHESPVLQPGTYSRIPRISQWEAPGHILTEEQVQKNFIRNVIPSNFNGFIKLEEEETIFEVWSNTFRPNAGFPLPGHVMATPQYGPGTETWKEYGMESWEEYDRSLNEK